MSDPRGKTIAELEEEQALIDAEKSTKIKKFISGIGWQVCVFITLVYATFLDNSTAVWLLQSYVTFMVLGGFSFIAITFRSMDSMLTTNLSKFKDNLTPSAKAISYLGTAFTCIEVPILIYFGFYWFAGAWLFTEIFQYTSSWKIQRAIIIEARENAKAEILMEDLKKDPQFSRGLMETLAELNQNMLEIDEVIDAAEKINRTDPTDTQTDQLKEMKLDREKLSERTDQVIRRAAEIMADAEEAREAESQDKE